MIGLMLTNFGQNCWEREEREPHSSENPWFLLSNSKSYTSLFPYLKKRCGRTGKCLHKGNCDWRYGMAVFKE